MVVVRGDDLYAVQADGKSAVQLTHVANGMFDTNPAYSPDGSLLAYSQHTPASAGQWGRAELRLMRADGSDDRLLAPAPNKGERAESPAWAPDGQSLYFARDVPRVDKDDRYVGDALTVERVSVEGGPAEVVASGAIDPATSTSGALAWVAYNPVDSSFRLQFKGPDDGQPRTLLTNKDFQSIWSPAISPDGRTIAFSASGRTESAVGSQAANPLAPPTAEAHGLPWDPWVLGADGAGLKKMARIGSDEQAVAWSPDGSELAVSNLSSVFVMRADGGGLTAIINHGDPGGIAWKS